MLKRLLCMAVCVMVMFTSIGAIALATENTAVTTVAFANTTTGGVMGYNENGINHFWGIPYAKADRFMPAEAYDAWEGYLPCWGIGESAPQMDTYGPFDFMPNSMQVVEDEAKMFRMHIQSPDLTPTTLKPVVFWIHGGGFTSGASMEFDFYSGANLAEYGDVVFVSTNHRLNVLGYLDLSAYGEEYKYSGNLGIMDLVFGLQWVRDNIAQFGGDPNNVTIVGQSGGGSKVTALMSSPAAKGLFHKAAALSGGAAMITRDTQTAQAETEAVLALLGITADTIDAIKTVPFEELLTAYNAAGVRAGPVVDGDFFPTGTYEMSADIPFLAGSVLGEFSTNIGGIVTHNQASEEAFAANLLDISDDQVMANLEALYGDGAQGILDAFKEAYPTHKAAGALYLNDRFNGFMVPSRLLQAMNDYGGVSYQYVQAYVYPMFGGIVPIHTASCIPFWFHNTDMISAWIAGDEGNAQNISDNMAGALVSFAYTGNPSQEGLQWEPWTTENGAVMVFDVDSGIREHHDDALFDLIKEYKKDSGLPF